MTTTEKMGERLKKLRKSRGLTISEVSQKTGISASTYKEWESGRQIRGEPYRKLAEVFEVSLHELLTGEKPKLNQLVEIIDQTEHLLRTLKKELFSSMGS
jgi:transcriptional regulator with XRE-family HTH domain